MADCRGRNTEFLCGVLKTHVPRRGLEGAQLDKGRKLSHAARVDEIHSAAHEIFAFAFATTEMEKVLAAHAKEQAPWHPSRPLPKRCRRYQHNHRSTSKAGTCWLRRRGKGPQCLVNRR